jgi:hypothetical protein
VERGYIIELSEVAENVYHRLYKDAQKCIGGGDEHSSRVKQFRIVEDTLDRLIPHDPFAPERALSGVLAGIFRIKKGRLQICCVADSATRRIVVLYISKTPRKEGDSHDPYRALTRLVRSGNFKGTLDAFGFK